MPWLPLAILLIATLTVAALALILFPPGEEQDEQPKEVDVTDDAGDEAAEEDLAPPPINGDPPRTGANEVPRTAPDPPNEPA